MSYLNPELFEVAFRRRTQNWALSSWFFDLRWKWYRVEEFLESSSHFYRSPSVLVTGSFGSYSALRDGQQSARSGPST